jgi:hypothetical protein
VRREISRVNTTIPHLFAGIIIPDLSPFVFFFPLSSKNPQPLTLRNEPCGEKVGDTHDEQDAAQLGTT